MSRRKPHYRVGVIALLMVSSAFLVAFLSLNIPLNTSTAQGANTATPCFPDTELAPPFDPFGSAYTASLTPSPTVTPCASSPSPTHPTFTPSPVGTLTPTPTASQTSRFVMEAVEDPDQGIDYPIFLPSDSATLNLVGSTSIQIDNILRLTTYNDQVNFAGAMWSKSKQTVNTGFETTFTFQVTRPVNTGGDGFAFVLQNSSATAVGIGGCGQGYQGIGNSLIIEFDLYYNIAECPETNDPSDNHLGIMYNGSRNHSSPSLVYDIPKTQLDMKDGLVHVVTLTYVAATTTLTVKIDETVTWSASVNLAQAGIGQDGTMWVGLTGGTFLARQNHNVRSWTFVRVLQTATPSPTPVRPSPMPMTPTSSATPVGVAPVGCTVSPIGSTQTERQISVFRAPIEGNPVEGIITFENQATLIVDGYAVDPLIGNLWLHLQGVVPTPASSWSWVMVTVKGSRDYQVGEINVPTTIFRPKLGTLWEVFPLRLSLSDIDRCLGANLGVLGFNKSNQYTLPVAPSWSLPAAFTWIPLSVDSVCQNSGFNAQGENRQIRGLGFYDLELYPQYMGYHPGIDFFGDPPSVQRKSGVYSIADSGIVVGIAIDRNEGTSAAKWGASDIVERPGYSIIVRYGHLFVLYGHLAEIDPTIYVGKRVDEKTRLGSIGTFRAENSEEASDPHLHLEIRTFGSSVDPLALVVKTTGTGNLGNGNDHGILELGGKIAFRVYDIAQMFAVSPRAYAQDYDGGTATMVVNPLGPALQNDSTVVWSPRCHTKYLTDPSVNTILTPVFLGTNVPVVLRGFQFPYAGDPPDPNLTPNPASHQ